MKFLLIESNLPSKEPNTTITAEIIEVFEPVTISPVMRVRLKGERKPAVLKLYDRRFGPLMRKNANIHPWNQEREQMYRHYVQSGLADEFISYLNNDDEDDDEGDWTDAQDETFLYDKCCDLYDAETLAYHALGDLQGIGIPELLATVSLQPYLAADPKLQKFFDIRGLLVEDCDGFTLDKLADNAPPGCWQSICDDAVSIVNSVSDHGILNKDVKPENFVVRKTTSNAGTQYKPVMIDFAHSRLRKSDEANADWIEEKRSQDEEGAVGFVMQHKLRKRGDYYKYKPSYRYDNDSTGGLWLAIQNRVYEYCHNLLTHFIGKIH